MKSIAAPTPITTVRRPAIASVWPTPTSSSAIERDVDDLRRRSEVRRRQGHSRRHGPVAGGDARGRCARSRHHQRRHRRQHRHLQGRRRRSRRPHLRRSARRAIPAIMDGVTPGLEIGASTEILAGEGHILTAGGIDSHVHFISPNQIPDAFYSGITTLIGGGTGPATGTNATTCTPGAWNIRRMYEAVEGVPAELRISRQGQRVERRAASRTDSRRRDRPEAARGLGHDAGRDRSVPVGRRRVRRAGGDSHRHAQRDAASSKTRSRRSTAGRFTRITPKAPAAATRPTSSGCAASRTSCPRPRIRRCRSRGTRWTSTSTC